MQTKSDLEIKTLLDKIFFDVENFLLQIASNGWKNSEYVNFLHPTAWQQYESSKIMSENINTFSKKNEPLIIEPVENFKQDNLEEVNELEECIEILAHSVYHIFSNNHSVIDEDNIEYDLGSARGSGETIAEYLNDNYFKENPKYDYINFYLGSLWFKEYASWLAFYEHIFKILKANNCNWIYSFPRLYLHNFDNPNEDISTAENLNYDATKALEKQFEENKKNEELDKFKNDLNKVFDNEFEDAKYKPLVEIVQAYKNIFGFLPVGHPQKEFE